MSLCDESHTSATRWRDFTMTFKWIPEKAGWRECDRERCTVAINAALYVVCKFRPMFFGVILCRAGAGLIRVRVRPWYQVCAARTPLPFPAPVHAVQPIRCTRPERTYRALVPRARAIRLILCIYGHFGTFFWVARSRFCLSSHARCSGAYLNAYISWRRALAKRVCMKTLSLRTDGPHLNRLLYRPRHSGNRKCCGWHFEERNICFEEISRLTYYLTGIRS